MPGVQRGEELNPTRSGAPDVGGETGAQRAGALLRVPAGPGLGPADLPLLAVRQRGGAVAEFELTSRRRRRRRRTTARMHISTLEDIFQPNAHNLADMCEGMPVALRKHMHSTTLKELSKQY